MVLTNNSINELGDLEPLRELRSLQYLSLIGNPVKEKKWYREWIIFRIPSLRVLDFQRIREKVCSSQYTPQLTRLFCDTDRLRYFKERQAAQSLFVTPEGLLTGLASTISTTVSSNAAKTATNADEPKAASAQVKAGRLMTDEEKSRVRAAIAAAKTTEEIQRLERSLREGWVPDTSQVGA